MSKVVEIRRGEYLTYSEIEKGKYVSQTFSAEALEQPCHFDRFKQILNVRQKMEEE